MINQINTILLAVYASSVILASLSPTWKNITATSNGTNGTKETVLYEGLWQFCDMTNTSGGEPWYFLNCTFYETNPQIMLSSIFAGGSILGLFSFLLFLLIVSCSRPKHQNKWLRDTSMLLFLFSFILMNIGGDVYIYRYWKEIEPDIPPDQKAIWKILKYFLEKVFVAAYGAAIAAVIGIVIFILNILNTFYCSCCKQCCKKKKKTEDDE